MPNGFVGNASQKYLTLVQDALQKAHEIHSKDPHEGKSYQYCSPPALPARTNYSIINSPDSGKSGSHTTGVGNESNMVVDENEYTAILNQLRMTDSKVAEKLNTFANQIENFCSTIYIVPSTLPKYLKIVDNVKTSLNEFQDLMEETENLLRNYVSTTIDVDNR